MTDVQPGTDVGWPFWAPSDDDGASRALDLAGVRPGDRVADLGCGDGRVLVAAARRGADVTGVESDAELAMQARTALAEAGLVGEVLEADLFAVDLDVDVVFCYLTPATLQRLVPRLRDGMRLVTVDFDVPGLVPDACDGAARLYLLPATSADVTISRGWPTGGTLAVAPPGVESLTCLEVVHPGGRVEVTLSPSLESVVTVQTGADAVAPGTRVAVDLVWAPGADRGAVHAGSLRVEGIGAHALLALRDDWDELGAQWELSDEGAANIAAHVATHAGPHNLATLLSAAEGEGEVVGAALGNIELGGDGGGG
jgi:hypothetical protein